MALNPFKLYSQISALLKLKGAINNMKMSELSTSSGRLVLLNILGTVALAIAGLLPAVLVAKIAAGLTAAYILYRTVAPALEGLAKMTATTKDDVLVSELAAAVKILTDKLGTPAAVSVTTDQPNVKVEVK